MSDGDGAAPPEEPPVDTDLRPETSKPRPLIAATVIALGALVVMRLARDLPFALHRGEPEAITADSKRLPADDTFVSLTGLPDRRNALYLSPRGSKSALLFFRVHGTDSKLFVRAAASTTKVDPQEKWQGRLRRFDALPYADTLRSFYAERVSARRYLNLEPLFASLGASPVKLNGLVDRTGRAAEVSTDTEVELTLVFQDQLRVLLQRSKFPTEDDAKHEVERLGLQPISLADPDPYHFVMLIAAPPAQRDKLMEKLEAQQITVRLRDVRTKVKLGLLSVVAQPSPQLVIPADLGLFYAADEAGKLVRTTRLPIAAVSSISLDEPVKIPADAMVLLEDETPAAMWWVPLLAGGALLFVLFNLFVLARSLRKQQPASA